MRAALSVLVLFGIALISITTNDAFADTFFVDIPSGASLPTCVNFANGCFDPDFIPVNLGDSVIWINKDSTTHTSVSGTQASGPDGLWNSGNILSSNSFTVLMDTLGTHDYFCTIHPWMRGVVQVVDLVNNPIPQPIPKGSITIDLELVASDLVAPVHLTHAGDGSRRLFVVDQPGQIRIIENGELLTEPFLDITDRIITLGIFGSQDENDFDERGLLGLAFHQDYSNLGTPGFGKIYTYSSEPVAGPADFTVVLPAGATFDHQAVLAEWMVSSTNPNIIDQNSLREIMRIDEPQFSHNAGMLEFGPDGYLYIALGDGGGARDSDNGHGDTGNGQDKSNILASIIRIDPLDPTLTTGSSDSVSSNGNYRIPKTNPFVGDSQALDEIFAFGFRNPWRFSFDEMTGQMIAADVGERRIEEIDIVTAGGNYGWSLKEGTFAFDRDTAQLSFDLGGLPGNLIDPVAQYDHDEGHSITGGFVYRGQAIPELFSRYVFGDFSSGLSIPSGRLFHVNLNDGEIKEFILAGGDPPLDTFVKSTGQDEEGELYFLVGQNLGPFPTSEGEKLGKVLKIVPVGDGDNCFPPLFGDWVIDFTCILKNTVTASANVIVQNGATLTIPNGLSVTIPSTNSLTVQSGGSVVIESGGTITFTGLE